MNYFTQLKELLDASSAPYSGFNVASIVITRDGSEYRGVNVESAAYPTTICAERNAIHTAVTEGARRGDIQEAQAYLLKIDVADGQSYEVDTYHETNTGHRWIEVLHYTLIDMQ